MQRMRGFTLVELVMVIALAAVVAVMVSTVMSRPLESFVAQSRRAELTDLAANALERMVREIRQAVPNSLRSINGDQGLELLPIHEAGRYRGNQIDLDPVTGAPLPNALRHDPPRCLGDTCRIDVLSPILSAASVKAARWMVIYNIGAGSASAPQAGGNVWAYGNPGVITPAGVGFDLASPPGQQLVLSGAQLDGFGFAYASPQHRFYLVREVLGFRCVSPGELDGNGTGRLERAAFDDLDIDAGDYAARSRMLANHVSACSIRYQSGTHARNGLVTIQLEIMKDGEKANLLRQVHVDNAP